MWELVTQVLSQMLFLVLHVVNSSSFPKPLSHAQEREALAAMRQGDTAARQKLIEHNLRLVAHIIKNITPPPRIRRISCLSARSG